MINSCAVMKNLKYIVFFLLCTSHGLAHATNRGSIADSATPYNTVCTMRHTIPVLTLKDANAVLKITAKPAKGGIIEGIVLDLNGTSRLKDIMTITLYRASGNGTMNNSMPVASVTNIRKRINIPLHIEVNEGDSLVIWVALRLVDKVNLTNRYNINCHSVTVDGKTYSPSTRYKRGLRAGVALRQQKQDGVHTSRIPGIVALGKKTLIAVYDARYDSSRDLQGDIDICCQRSTDGGETWGKMYRVLDMGTYGNLPEKYNGVSDAAILFDKKTGDVWVAATWMHGVLDRNTGRWIENLNEDSTVWNHQWASHGSQPGLSIKQTSQIIITKSSDRGLTWSKPMNITSQVKAPKCWLQTVAPGNGISLRDGTIVFPAQGRDSIGNPFSNLIYSRDGGMTWKATRPVGHNTTECAIVQRNDGTLMLNMRDNSNRNDYSSRNGRRICVATNLGAIWKEHHTSHKSLIEPVCMGSLYQHFYNNGKKSVLLFSNPESKKSRTHITLKSSYDDGETWAGKKILLDELKGAGYSCITSVDQKHIGILYESSQSDMVFQVVKLNEIL